MNRIYSIYLFCAIYLFSIGQVVAGEREEEKSPQKQFTSYMKKLEIEMSAKRAMQHFEEILKEKTQKEKTTIQFEVVSSSEEFSPESSGQKTKKDATSIDPKNSDQILLISLDSPSPEKKKQSNEQKALAQQSEQDQEGFFSTTARRYLPNIVQRTIGLQ